MSARPTSHQAEVFRRLHRLSRAGTRWVHERNLGSHSALWHLVRKGHAEAREVIGPRGGVTYEYRSK